MAPHDYYDDDTYEKLVEKAIPSEWIQNIMNTTKYKPEFMSSDMTKTPMQAVGCKLDSDSHTLLQYMFFWHIMRMMEASDTPMDVFVENTKDLNPLLFSKDVVKPAAPEQAGERPETSAAGGSRDVEVVEEVEEEEEEEEEALPVPVVIRPPRKAAPGVAAAAAAAADTPSKAAKAAKVKTPEEVDAEDMAKHLRIYQYIDEINAAPASHGVFVKMVRVKWSQKKTEGHFLKKWVMDVTDVKVKAPHLSGTLGFKEFVAEMTLKYKAFAQAELKFPWEDIIAMRDAISNVQDIIPKVQKGGQQVPLIVPADADANDAQNLADLEEVQELQKKAIMKVPITCLKLSQPQGLLDSRWFIKSRVAFLKRGWLQDSFQNASIVIDDTPRLESFPPEYPRDSITPYGKKLLENHELLKKELMEFHNEVRQVNLMELMQIHTGRITSL